MSITRAVMFGWAIMLSAGLGLAAEAGSVDIKQSGGPVVEEKIIIDKIWSSVRVGFCLLTHGDMQYVAYYNADRRMVVGMRKLGGEFFTTKVLPSKSSKPPRESSEASTIQGWDSHNYITMAVDKEGCIHLSGNMHASPLLYFRSSSPNDITTMIQVDSMVGKNEKRTTYPKFMEAPDGSLIFHYRDGGSGNGNEIFNIYSEKDGTWRRFLQTPLIDGQGRMNAYQNGPALGPDGWYHLLWVWRDSPDAATNHDLSYARSRDLLHWESVAGEPLELPITFLSKGVLVDPIPVRGGIINGCHKFAFDSRNRIVVSYHKHDENGNTQAYAARFEAGKWNISRISAWEGKHIFEGGGSGPSTFGTRLSLGSIEQHGEGRLSLSYSHWKAGQGVIVFDEETLNPLGVETEKAKQPVFPADLARPQSDFPGMTVRWTEDSGRAPDKKSRYVLRCETLGSNRDRPRDGELPENSDLVLYRITGAASDQ